MIKMIDKSSKYYFEKKEEILYRFSTLLHFIKVDLAQKISEEELNRLIKKFYRTYYNKISEIPYIGGDKNRFTRNIAYSSPAIILWKIFKSSGWKIDKFAHIYLKALKRFNKQEFSGIKGHFKRIVHRILIRKCFLSYVFNKQKKLLEDYPNNFIFKPLKVNKDDFDFGYLITQCPIVEFGKSQGAEEILPYICSYDFFRSYYTRSGLIRSKTLAEGDDYCDFKFKKGNLPKNLQKTEIPEKLKPGR